MTLREKIECMEAFERGEEIEVSDYGYDEWRTVNNPSWSWNVNKYRIKPKLKQTVTIEKWLCECSYNGYLIYEGTREYFEDSKIETIKLISTCEVEL